MAALARKELLGSAFDALATVQSIGHLAASAIAGVLWSSVSPTAAFVHLARWTVLAPAGLLVSIRR
ncbi:hypothetical protein [Streptacidiphilus jiangxiensis]|uniref:Uncharacterized protein n=1 Tax=Streptacidiphilus jiangxiensis TaxID=235985 RepID=A0A1H7X8F0_STRJI|nr:hypothetical protein [Streptacidiphilus jiangxiensis]SEM29408.1 hypothetical protein SAMN05414137_1232 [Streptacidiphilus jiangxiensis]